ncbi:MAG TPA: hypothetical protein VF171_05510 [Trueperaceae bacterium]
MRVTPPQWMRLAGCLVLAAATLWLPLSGSVHGARQPGHEPRSSLSAPLPAVMEAGSRPGAFMQPERRGLLAASPLVQQQSHAAAPAGRLVVPPAERTGPAVGRLSLIAWHRLQLEGG